ncbi:flagellar hook capping FlgD N-terminal domain-containing protein [Pandoraea bronchicola]|uniref:Basal-body rod modification protein FlgD n=1 Tax=Pandoraea bronchicola TaxID=2508287 RepID=A0A5E5BY16_9BURK|nr:flagellar hook capping FlgD N-terminal domain-containing protein [Pandoraea bronchicola]VVE90699.1 flagellar basal body rod modification protein FlgD [Pandoraea bronchicola]
MAVGSTTPIDSTTLQSSSLGMQDFLKILLTQLTYQDPLKPMDNQQFMAQMAQFTTLEQTQQLNDKIGQLISTQATLQSVGLIGKTVDATTASGTVTGTVTALTLDQNTPQLSIKTTNGAALTGISLSQLTAVR